MTEFEQAFANEVTEFSFTDRISALEGKFTISDSTVTYFQANLKIEQVAEYLKLTEEVPVEHRHEWSLEELFQRDIDWNRVESEIVAKYLRNSSNKTFFNALTIALLPKSLDGNIEDSYMDLSDAYEWPDEEPFNHTNYSDLRIGGIRIAKLDPPREQSVSYIKWDTNRVFPVAIDGQHRLAAIKKLVEGRLSKEQRETSVPIIFLILDPRAGFFEANEDSNATENPLLISVREIFIHLNKNARKVTKAREILLDDNDLESRCTRELISEKTLVESDDRIPLGLVNWKDDVAKFDFGPYFTSILSLYSSVIDTLKIYKVKDPTDENQVSTMVKSVNKKLFIDREDFEAGEHAEHYASISLEDYVKANFENEEDPKSIVGLPREYMLKAVDSFNAIYRPIFITIFKQFVPYRDFCELSRSLGGIDNDFAAYNALPQSGQDKRPVEEREIFEESKTRLEEFKSGKWPFMVVWQKALFRASMDAFEKSTTDEPHEFLPGWLDFLNQLSDAGLFDTETQLNPGDTSLGQFWEGICKNPQTRTISWSGASIAKTQKLLVLLWYFFNYLSEADEPSSKDFYELLISGEGNQDFPGADRYCMHVTHELIKVISYGNEQAGDDALASLARDRFIKIIDRVKGAIE